MTTEPYTVLVVEDNPLTRKAIALALRAAGYAVLGAGDGGEALAILAEVKPDLAFLDLVLPDMDGIALARQIRDRPNGAETVLIALSGIASRLDEACTLSRGFSDLLFKPVEPSKLVERARRFLPSPSAAQPAAQPGRNRRVLLVDDDPTQRKLAHLWLAKGGFDVRSASSARAALIAASESPPDAIVSDLIMPDMDGLSLCRAIRGDPRLAATPYVLTSASHSPSDDADQATALGAGVSAFVPRTPALEFVIDALVAHLNHQPLARPVAFRETPSPETPVYSARAIRQLEQQAALNESLAHAAASATAQLAILTSVATVVAGVRDLDAILHEALARTLDVAGVSVGAIYLLEPDGSLRLACHIGVTDPLPRSPALHATLSADRATTTWGPGRDSQMAVVPIVAAGERLGVLCVGSPRGHLGGQWLDLVTTVGAQLAPAVALARTVATVRESEQRYRSLLERERGARLAAEHATAEARALAGSLEHANTELTRMAAAAGTANRAKSEFLAVMSHELRTPLNAIGGYAQLLEMEVFGPVTEAQRMHLLRIQETDHHLVRLIEKVFDFTKVDMGQPMYHAEAITVHEAMAGLGVLVEPGAHARGVTIDIPEETCDALVVTDREKVRQILVHLCANAIEFTDAGGRVTVACEEIPDAVLLRVSDTGIGIPADQLEKIFEPFVQLDAGLTRRHGGIGLGLAISRAYARGLGGDLLVTSEPGRGSTFVLRLPRTPP
jgi:signal transduction histidine kinase/FixJ family two-component response regulator